MDGYFFVILTSTYSIIQLSSKQIIQLSYKQNPLLRQK